MADFEHLPEAMPPSTHDRWRLARFVVVGIVNTGFSYGVYALLIVLGLSYAVANLVALLFGIVFSFKTQGRLVFRQTSNRRLWRFVLVWAVIYAANTALIGLIISRGFDPYTAGALTLPVNVILSYVAQKYFVFRGPSGS
jgi:putative flippase GtrA